MENDTPRGHKAKGMRVRWSDAEFTAWLEAHKRKTQELFRLKQGGKDWIDSVVHAWLEASNRDPGARTAGTYAKIMEAFRRWLEPLDLDLASADCQWLSANLPYERIVACVRTLLDTSTDHKQFGAMAMHTDEQAEYADQDEQTQHVESNVKIDYVEELGTHRARELANALQEFAATRFDARNEHRVNRPTSPATQAQRITVVGSFYRFAFKHEFLSGSSPMDMISRPSPTPQNATLPIPQPVPFMERLALIDRSTDSGARDFALLLTGLTTGRHLSELQAMRLGDISREGDCLLLHWPRLRGGSTASDRLPLTGSDATPAQALLSWIGRLKALLHSGSADVVTPADPSAQSPVWVSLARNLTAGHQLTTSAIATICQQRLGTRRVQYLRYTAARRWEGSLNVAAILQRLGQVTYSEAYESERDASHRRLVSPYGIADSGVLADLIQENDDDPTDVIPQRVETPRPPNTPRRVPPIERKLKKTPGKVRSTWRKLDEYSPFARCLVNYMWEQRPPLWPAQFAERMGIPKHKLSRWLNSDATPPLAVVVQLAHAMQLPADPLLIAAGYAAPDDSQMGFDGAQ